MKLTEYQKDEILKIKRLAETIFYKYHLEAQEQYLFLLKCYGLTEEEFLKILQEDTDDKNN